MRKLAGLLLLLVLLLQATYAQIPTLEILEDALKIKGVSRFDIASPEEGMFIYDMFTETIWYHDGSSWVELGGRVPRIEDIDGDTEVIATDFPVGFSDHVLFNVNGTPVLRLSQKGTSVKMDIHDLQADESLYIGDDAGQNDETGLSNIGIGSRSLYEINDGIFSSSNVALGAGTLERLGNGIGSGTDLRSNVALGHEAAHNLVDGHHNTNIGSAAGFNMINGSGNVLIGNSAGSPYFQGGSNNTILGPYDAFGGYTSFTQSGVVKIGHNAGYDDTNSNILHIANRHDKSLIYGEFANDYLRIGGELNINDEYSFPTTDGTASQVLTTDGSGNVNWTDDQTGAFENTVGLIRSTGDHTADDFLFGSNALPPAVTIADTMMFYIAEKGAFRAGSSAWLNFITAVPTDRWSDGKIGSFSTAFGLGNEASGFASFATGHGNIVTGTNSTSIGSFNNVEFSNAGALGNDNEVLANRSFAIGHQNETNGAGAIAIGADLINNSYEGVAIGRYNEPVVLAQTLSIDLTAETPLFMVGNGKNSSDRSNAMVVREDGKVGIGNLNYNSLLNVGRSTGDGITIGTAEKLEDGGTFRLLTNSGLFSEFHLTRDIGTNTAAWDDIYADDFNTISDMRAKKDVQELEYGLQEILDLSTINYLLKDDPDQERKLGLSAQELLSEVPEVVKTHDTIYHEDGTKERVELDRYAVNYTELIPVLIKSIQEQQAEIDNLKSSLMELAQKIKSEK